jgi:dihydrofolate reductase
MPGPSGIEGFAIISADGMIADASGAMPDALHVPADQKFFHAGLDRAAALVHGRHSHEGDGPQAAHRRRLIVTRRVPAVAHAPDDPRALFWNPAGASLREAWTALGANDGMLAVLGGADVYALFWDGYDAFHLTRVARARIPGGRPVFREVASGRAPEEVLKGHGLIAAQMRVLEPEVTLVTWRR